MLRRRKCVPMLQGVIAPILVGCDMVPDPDIIQWGWCTYPLKNGQKIIDKYPSVALSQDLRQAEIQNKKQKPRRRIEKPFF